MTPVDPVLALAGRGVITNQFLKDLFQACMMDDVDYLAIAVRHRCVAAGIKNPDFDRVVTFLDLKSVTIDSRQNGVRRRRVDRPT